MIATGNYRNWDTSLYKVCSISGDRGNMVGYKGKCYPKLAPKMSFWKIWHSNIGVISEIENNKYYIEEYYKQVLSKLDPQTVYDDLDYHILLCYEQSNEFCHRHIVSSWFELFLVVEVNEKTLENNYLENIERPAYIKEVLEDVIKKNKNMRGFNSLAAIYLFEKSEDCEKEAEIYEKETGKSGDSYRQMACYLRCDADEAEAKYNELKRKERIKRK